jgi:hypothetical protein
MGLKKVAFWVAVTGAGAVLGPFLLELAADKLPIPGFQRLVGYIHRGPNGGN